MAKKVIKIGSSLGITLCAAHLKKLNLVKGSDVEIVINNKKQCLEIFKPSDSEAKDESSFLKRVNDLATEYSQELEKLTNEW